MVNGNTVTSNEPQLLHVLAPRIFFGNSDQNIHSLPQLVPKFHRRHQVIPNTAIYLSLRYTISGKVFCHALQDTSRSGHTNVSSPQHLGRKTKHWGQQRVSMVTDPILRCTL